MASTSELLSSIAAAACRLSEIYADEDLKYQLIAIDDRLWELVEQVEEDAQEKYKEK